MVGHLLVSYHLVIERIAVIIIFLILICSIIIIVVIVVYVVLLIGLEPLGRSPMLLFLQDLTRHKVMLQDLLRVDALPWVKTHYLIK